MGRPLREWIHLLFNNDHDLRTVLFRVDGGPVRGLSFGHLSRCINIASVLEKSYKSEALFLMRSYPEGVKYVRDAGQEIGEIAINSESRQEWTIIKKTINELRPDWLVVDLPYNDLDTSYFSKLKEQGVKILFIDDSRFIHPNVNVFLNSSVLAPQRAELNARCGTRYLLGPEFFVFDEAQIDTNVHRKVNEMFNVLITLGGSDPTGLTLKVLETLFQEEWHGVFFRIILGPGYRNVGKVTALLEPFGDFFEVVANPPNVIPFFQECDLAVCNGGRTLYELSYLGKKSLPIASAEHEAEVIAEFIRQGMIDFGLTVWEANTFLMHLKTLILQ